MAYEDIDMAASQFGAALDRLKPLTQKFSESINMSSMGTPPAFTKLGTSPNGLTGSVFGVAISADSRPVVIGGIPAAVEHTFFGTYRDTTYALLSVYQWPNGKLTKDIDPTNHLCDVDNEYVTKILIGLFISAIKELPFFQPSA